MPKDAMHVDAHGGAEIRLVVGDTVIPAVLNGCRSARALMERLPYTIRLSRYEHDYCGVMDKALPYAPEDVHGGWRNGDIAFALSGDYFAILYKDEEISEQYDGMVTLGALTGPLAVMDTLGGAISVTIESA
ncbi:MAG: cyclophilin-like fold protein [Desulfovibrionaceae bacterium]